MISGASLLSYVSCHQSHRIGVTFIHPIPFLALSWLYAVAKPA